jgi:heptosyltransferase-2
MDIIVLPLYGIGDVLMSTPALRNLKERTGARITCLHMFRTTRDMLIGNPNVDENHHFPFLDASRLEGTRFLLGFRKRYDASINFYPSNRRDYTLAAFIIGAPLRIGHRYVRKDISQLNFLKNCTVRESDDLHNVEEDMRLLGFLGINDPEPYPMELHLTGEEESSAAGWLRDSGLEGRTLIGFHPGSSLFKAHAKKRWPAEKFSALIKELAKTDKDAAFLLFGGREELPLKEEVIEFASGVRDRILTVETDGIRETAAIMQHCKVFVANDSGLMHLSAVLQVPVVGLFGPTNPKWLRPWGCEHRVIRLDVCPPCFRYSPVPQKCYEDRDFACVRDVPVEEVYGAVRELFPG